MDIAHGIPQALIDRFEPLSLVGQGGMGIVYLARDRELRRLVAIKILIASSDEVQIRRFAREAAVLARLAHPRIVRVFDAGTAGPGDEGVPYIVMEYLEGQSLSDRLQRGPLRPAELATLVEATLAGLQAIHELQILHRDIKPPNLFLADGRGPVLLDFGLAVPPDVPSLTRTGRIVGTLRYLAPEVIQGQPATVASDLFALGVTLIEAWLGVDVHANVDQDRFEARPSRLLASLSSGAYLDTAQRALAGRGPLATAVLRLLSPLPEGRFASIAELQAFLTRERALASLAPPAPSSVGHISGSSGAGSLETASPGSRHGDAPGTASLEAVPPADAVPHRERASRPWPGRRWFASGVALAAAALCGAFALHARRSSDSPHEAAGTHAPRSPAAGTSPFPAAHRPWSPPLGTGLRAGAAGIVDLELWPAWLHFHELLGRPAAMAELDALCASTIDRMIELAPLPGRELWVRTIVQQRLGFLQAEMPAVTAVTDRLIALRKDQLLLDGADRLARTAPAAPAAALARDVALADQRNRRLALGLARLVDVYLANDQVLETGMTLQLAALRTRAALALLPETLALLNRETARWKRRYPGHWAVLYIDALDKAGKDGASSIRSFQDAIDALDFRFGPGERLSRADVFCIRFEMRRELAFRLRKAGQRDQLDPLVQRMLSEMHEAERLHPALVFPLDRLKRSLLATVAP